MTAVPQLSSVARAAPQMALPSMADAKSLSDEEIAKEILTAQKVRGARPLCLTRRHPPSASPVLTVRSQELFELRKKVKTRQEVGPRGPSRPLGMLSPSAFGLYTIAGEAAPVHPHQAPHRAAQHAPRAALPVSGGTWACRV